MNILHIYASDCNRFNYKKTYTTEPAVTELAICQSALSLCLFAFPFFDWWWVQALFSIGHNQEEATGSIKTGKTGGIVRGRWLLCSLPAPVSWDYLSNKRSVSLSCNLSVVLNPLVHRSKCLLRQDKNQGREINQTDMHKHGKKRKHWWLKRLH